MKTQYYRQCKLRKKLSDTSHSEMVTWLPEKYAIKNKFLMLRNNKHDGHSGGCCVGDPEYTEWDDGWQVIEVGAKQKADIVEARERDYKKWRRQTDI